MKHSGEQVRFHHPFDESTDIRTKDQLVAEICVRLVQLREMTGGAQSPFVSRWIATVYQLYKADPRAMWLYLSWQTGDHDIIAASFEDKAIKHATARQAVQQGTAQAMNAIARVSPELAVQMRAVYVALIPEAERARQAKDPSLAANA